MPANPTPPRDAMHRFLKDKSAGSADKTIRNYRYTLRRFCEFLNDWVESLEQLTSDDIQRFKEARLSEVSTITCRQDMMVVQQFVRFCSHIGITTDGLAEMVRIPSVDEDDEVADEILTKEEASAVLDHLQRYEYATARHVTVTVIWRTGMRISGLIALDVDDFEASRPALELRNRPETPLKNRSRSERDVAIREDTANVIEDYLDQHHPGTTDEMDRVPLMASGHGRMSSSTIQRYVYSATRPCVYGDGCPFDGYDPEDCEALSWNGASKCPGSVSPHSVRAGYVTAALNAGQSKTITGDRTDMGEETLSRHYDRATREERAERRRGHLRDV